MTVERSRGPAILVVDDEESIRRLARRVLESSCFDVTVAATGDEALERISRDPPIDLLVSDLRMPGLNGSELGQRARALWPGLKVLYVTGHADDLFTDYRMLGEGEAFLEKPYTFQGLLEAVNQLLYGTTSANHDDRQGCQTPLPSGIFAKYWQKSRKKNEARRHRVPNSCADEAGSR